jgi:cytosine deaminase
MHYDLIIRNAQLHRHSRIVDIAVKDERFVKIAGDLSSDNAHEELDAAGRLVVPPFIDAHVHLDAVLTVGQPRYNATGSFAGK